MIKTKTLTAIAAALACSAPAFADDKVIQLKFEGLTVPVAGSTPSRPNVLVDDYYNGGQVKSTTTSDPVGASGPDFDVVITGVHVVAEEAQSNGGDGSFIATSGIGGTGALGIFGGPNGATTAIIDVVDGSSFNGQLSFYYSAAGGAAVNVQVDRFGADPTSGSAQFTFSGSPTCADQPDAAFCNWNWASFDLGSIGATRVSITGDGVLIDNLTLGAITRENLPDPTPAIPEPSTYTLMAFGLAAVGLTARRRQRRD